MNIAAAAAARAEGQAAVARYVDIDLSPASPAAQDLFARAVTEAMHPAITLTGEADPGALSANLTPAMNAWLGDHVVRARRGALATVQAAAARIRLSGGVDGIVEAIEQDRLKRQCAQNKWKETSNFYDRHQGKLDSFNKIDREHEELRTYEGERDAKVPSRWIEFGIPAMICIPEFSMNFASFLKLSGVVAIGAGSSIVVALAIAVASFITGGFLKAYSFYMHPGNEGQRSKGLRRIGLAAFLMIISLLAVGYARYHSVLEQVEAARILGLTPPNIVAQTVGLLAGNLLVFAIGAAITYLVHDENPDFATKAVLRAKLRAELDGVERRELHAKIRNIDSGTNLDRTKMQRFASLMHSQPESALVNELLSEVQAKDEQVVGLLVNYRNRLADRLVAIDPDFVFAGPTSFRHASRTASPVSLADFLVSHLRLSLSNS